MRFFINKSITIGKKYFEVCLLPKMTFIHYTINGIVYVYRCEFQFLFFIIGFSIYYIQHSANRAI